MSQTPHSQDGPLVSVLALCYNHERFVTDCLDSILKQTYRNWELIVVDDCSMDNSVKVVEAWIRKNNVACKFIRHTVNQGICGSLNDALRNASGKYVANIATDDMWRPNKLAGQVELLEKSGEKVGVAFGNTAMIDEHGKSLGDVYSQRLSLLGRDTIPQGDIHVELWNGNFVSTVNTLVRRSCYDVVGYYDEDLIYEDYDMWLRISRHFHFVYTMEIGAVYRVVATSMTRTRRDKMAEAKEKVFQKFLNDPTVEPGTKELISRKYVEYLAARHFEWRTRERHRWIWKAARTSGARYLVMLAFSLARLSYNHYMEALLLYRRCIGALGGEK